ncbi:MAG: SCO family protein [Alphaproteobacteria bacterium]|nr:MAG: SCO family protein [Alphaproteobacteria bacterium]
MTRSVAIAAGLALAAMLGVSIWLAFFRAEDSPFAACGGAQVAGGIGSIGGPFELVNAQGETVTDKDVFTKPSLVYFGYTFCPDVCPLDNARNAAAVDILLEKGYDVQPVFISVDPERDTPEVVGEWASYMHPRMIGLTGSPEQVKAASQAYKAYYRRNPGEDDYYLVDHSTFTYLVLPGLGVVDFFRRDETEEEVARRTACYIDAAERLSR